MLVEDIEYDPSKPADANIARALYAIANNLGELALAMDRIGLNRLQSMGAEQGALEKLACLVPEAIEAAADTISRSLEGE